jgi:hypothetical protein
MNFTTFHTEEKYYALRTEFEERGLRETSADTAEILWVNLKAVNFESPSYLYVNHFKGSHHFSNKVRETPTID